MKVLMTCDAVGGVWQYASDLAGALMGQGVEVVLVVLGPFDEARHPGLEPGSSVVPSDELGNEVPRSGRAWMPAQGRHDGIQLIRTNLPLDWLATGPDDVLNAGRAIAALAADHRVDLVHLNAPALAAGGPFPAPVVAVAHGCVGTWFAATDGSAPPAELAWHRQLMLAGLLAADAVIAPSASYAAAVQRHYDLPATPLTVHNGRALAMAPSGASADHVFTAGRLWDRAKNASLLDAVAARLPAPLRAAGPVTGPHGESIAPEHLHLVGTLDVDALAGEYAAGPIFVSAARFEPFGLAVLEAAQAGCPLILSDIDTFRELWTGAALFVGGDDPTAWVAAIERVRADPGLRAHLGEAARTRAARYTVEAMAAGTLAIYRALLAEPVRAAA